MNARVYEELLSRLDQFALSPKIVIDIGGHADGSQGALRQRFPKSRLISTGEVKRKEGGQGSILGRLWRRRLQVEHLTCAMHELPLADGSVDLVVAHDWRPGVDSLDGALTEIHRVLMSGGVFLSTTPSPTSLSGMADIHDFGSALMRAGFIEPVLDIDRFAGDDGEVIHVAAFAGSPREPHGVGEIIVPLSKISRR